MDGEGDEVGARNRRRRPFMAVFLAGSTRILEFEGDTDSNMLKV